MLLQKVVQDVDLHDSMRREMIFWHLSRDYGAKSGSNLTVTTSIIPCCVQAEALYQGSSLYDRDKEIANIIHVNVARS